MLLRPELQALRADEAPQRAAQLAMRDVLQRRHASAAGQALEAELQALDAGTGLAALPALGALVGDPAAARAFVAELVADFASAMAAHPLAHVPLRHFTDGCTSTLLIAGSGRASLSLRAVDGARLGRRSPPDRVAFVPCETWDSVIAGSAQGRRVVCRAERPGGAQLDLLPLTLCADVQMHRDGAREAMLFDSVEQCLVVLRLQRRTLGGVTREYNLEDGALVHQAAADPRDSRLELAAALLGRMGRSDAAPLLAAMAREEGSPALRWQVLRECLALDSRTGFATLCQIAANAADPLAAPAGALRAQLLEAHPVLAEIASCPV